VRGAPLDDHEGHEHGELTVAMSTPSVVFESAIDL
jgi:hypothetical protein